MTPSSVNTKKKIAMGGTTTTMLAMGASERTFLIETTPDSALVNVSRAVI